MIQDGEGNTSSMRVITFIIVLAIIVPKVWLAIKTGTSPVWSSDDMYMLGIILGGKLVQNAQENKSAPPTPKI